MVTLDLNLVCQRGIRIIGHSGSTIADLQMMLDQVESGRLSPNHTVAAVGSLEAAAVVITPCAMRLSPAKLSSFQTSKSYL
ncbi:MAG: hypothetical protein HC875_06485 [Anaerolineales bacterium]|nr:hypothetical protein [Anaerolineales bacterium]